jgi:hypothetical protein
MTDFFTDGVFLYEIASEQTVQNYGLTGGVIRNIILRDVVSGETCRVRDLDLAALTPVEAR